MLGDADKGSFSSFQRAVIHPKLTIKRSALYQRGADLYLIPAWQEIENIFGSTVFDGIFFSITKGTKEKARGVKHNGLVKRFDYREIFGSTVSASLHDAMRREGGTQMNADFR